MTRRKAFSSAAVATAAISSAVSHPPSEIDKKLPWELAHDLCREYGLENVIIFGEVKAGGGMGAKMCCHSIYPGDDRKTFNRACEISTTYGYKAVEGETVEFVDSTLS